MIQMVSLLFFFQSRYGYFENHMSICKGTTIAPLVSGLHSDKKFWVCEIMAVFLFLIKTNEAYFVFKLLCFVYLFAFFKKDRVFFFKDSLAV